MKKVLVILGQTATGKTDLGLELAKKYEGELISCDSRQVYTGLDIGTGKMPNINPKLQLKIQKFNNYWEINGIKIWMYDVCNPKNQYTVKDYVERAEKVIAEIHQRNKLPIIVGGTGFYLKALLEGLPNLEIPIDKKLREDLSNLSLPKLQEKLQNLSPARWNLLNESDKQNPRRLARSVELVSMYGYVKKTKILKPKCQKWNVLKIGLTAPREFLNNRIDLRLTSRINQGLVEEAINLHNNGLAFKRMKELGLEYGMLAKLLEGQISENQLVSGLSTKIHQYAKRQMTWFKNSLIGSGCINWFDVTEKNYQQKMEKMILKWYD